jgi:hypothetical protein
MNLLEPQRLLLSQVSTGDLDISHTCVMPVGYRVGAKGNKARPLLLQYPSVCMHRYSGQSHTQLESCTLMQSRDVGPKVDAYSVHPLKVIGYSLYQTLVESSICYWPGRRKCQTIGPIILSVNQESQEPILLEVLRLSHLPPTPVCSLKLAHFLLLFTILLSFQSSSFSMIPSTPLLLIHPSSSISPKATHCNYSLTLK